MVEGGDGELGIDSHGKARQLVILAGLLGAVVAAR